MRNTVYSAFLSVVLATAPQKTLAQTQIGNNTISNVESVLSLWKNQAISLSDIENLIQVFLKENDEKSFSALERFLVLENQIDDISSFCVLGSNTPSIWIIIQGKFIITKHGDNFFVKAL